MFSKDNSLTSLGSKKSSSSRKIIKRIVQRRMSDGTMIPIEKTVTRIERDGTTSIERKTWITKH